MDVIPFADSVSGKATSSKKNAVHIIPLSVFLKPEGSSSQKKRAGIVATTATSGPATTPTADGKRCCAASIVIYERSTIPLLINRIQTQ